MADAQRLQLTSQGAVLAVTAHRRGCTTCPATVTTICHWTGSPDAAGPMTIQHPGWHRPCNPHDSKQRLTAVQRVG